MSAITSIECDKIALSLPPWIALTPSGHLVRDCLRRLEREQEIYTPWPTGLWPGHSIYILLYLGIASSRLPRAAFESFCPWCPLSVGTLVSGVESRQGAWVVNCSFFFLFDDESFLVVIHSIGWEDARINMSVDPLQVKRPVPSKILQVLFSSIALPHIRGSLAVLLDLDLSLLRHTLLRNPVGGRDTLKNKKLAIDSIPATGIYSYKQGMCLPR